MDYSAKSDELGKNSGDDLAEGKPTLPLIYALQSSAESDAENIRQALSQAQEKGHLSEDEVRPVVELVCQSGAIERTVEQAKQQVELAIQDLDCLPAGVYKDALAEVARASVNRRF